MYVPPRATYHPWRRDTRGERFTDPISRPPESQTGAIDDTYRTIVSCNDAEKETEGKKIVEELARLKYEMQHDRALTPIRDDGEADVAAYNEELARLGTPTWFNVPWLYCECYLYRRMHTSFSLSTHWKQYDIFARQKLATFRSSRPAVLELAARYQDIITQLAQGKGADEAAERVLFDEMCEICLWGNATDLSLLTSLTYEDIQKLQGSEARKASEKNIIANDLGRAYEVLKQAQRAGKAERRVDIVLDNAGFELYVDLILAGYLLAAGLATHVVLHPKSMPWFVSDVVPRDFSDLLGALAAPRPFYETPSEDEQLQDKTPAPLADAEADQLQFLFQEWARLHGDGRLAIRPNRFWTQAGSYWRLPADEALAADLRESELVIFKGDLNYRKLTGDVSHLPPPSPFLLSPLAFYSFPPPRPHVHRDPEQQKSAN